ncbi:SDR family oxidoreductase [Streptomyces telluris]|uniref:SDR family oxidoreductase n=1 Tax=Streptomyces telluris TaxID=2720021 RepID=A0A9X2LBY7_9ACTN|nr:SDR family oxidoreductase [Streptomyces telluris]MCQ8768437.1 SDR family oxidoreductase [Streptomyces telluris]NJP79572.1 SDR family oxidoreductase [Streptomyces telluris]
MTSSHSSVSVPASVPAPASAPATTPVPAAAPLTGRDVVIVGGGSGIGLEVARRAVAAGARVVLGGRNKGKLAAAAQSLGDGARWGAVDTTDKESLARFFDGIERIDHLFTPAASYRVGPMLELSDADAESPFVSKFWGQYHAVKCAAPRLTPDASVVLMSGAASVRPPAAAPAYVACNAAIEGLGRGLAVELAPVRVNVVSPGTVDGNLWAQRLAAVREASFAQYGRDSLLHRPGTEGEIADAVLFLFANTFMTGSVLYPDGGYALR